MFMDSVHHELEHKSGAGQWLLQRMRDATQAGCYVAYEVRVVDAVSKSVIYMTRVSVQRPLRYENQICLWGKEVKGNRSLAEK
jgi:hypothetical protein